MKQDIIILSLIILLVFGHTYVQAQDIIVNGIYNADLFTEGKKAANDYVAFYQKYLSDLKGAKCAMYPTCSNYGKSVIEEHSLLSAIPTIADRMIRCSHDRHNYDRIYVNGIPALVDCPNAEYEKTLIKHTSPRTAIYKSSKDSTINFIAYLINNKEYSSALTEIRRAEYYKSTHFHTELLKQKLVCMRALGEYEKAIYEYETADNLLKQENTLINEISRTYYLTNNYPKSIEVLNCAKKTQSDSIDLYQAEIMKATAFARINNHNEMNNCVYNAIQIMGTNFRNTENLKLFNELQNIKTKNPKTAKWLSLFPGAGYLYTGHTGSAATSFLINGLLAYATYTSIKTENYGLAALTGFFNLSFYIGNIAGAGKSARRKNEINKMKIIRKIEHYNNLFNQ